jgi:hypothetical protein
MLPYFGAVAPLQVRMILICVSFLTLGALARFLLGLCWHASCWGEALGRADFTIPHPFLVNSFFRQNSHKKRLVFFAEVTYTLFVGWGMGL